MLEEAADEAGIELTSQLIVERVEHQNKSGRKISAIKWNSESPELILLHGGSQNAHTWDTVAMVLQSQSQLPLLAIDLPGHGLSEWRDDHKYSPKYLAQDIVDIIEELAPDAKGVMGMSLGGLTSIMLSGLSPNLVRALMLVDITPSINREKAEPILEFISGPTEFDSFEDILDYTQKFNPTRSKKSLVRGITNNAKELESGKWTWRWDPTKSEGEAWETIWHTLEQFEAPLILYKGGSSSSVLDDSDVEEFLSRKPDAETVIVPDAGHSIQGDKPVELAGLILDFLANLNH